MISGGTNYIVNHYALNVRNETSWGRNAAVYRPDLCLGSKLRRTKLRYQLWRFRFGSRQCMGKYVADLIIKQLLASMVQKFDLSLSEPRKQTFITPAPGVSVKPFRPTARLWHTTQFPLYCLP